MRVHTLDLRFQGIPNAIAAFLVEGPSGRLLFETGPASTLPALEAALAAHGLTPEALSAVFVSHIHLDHAGAAGHLAERGLPVHVHPVGAPHLADPARLLRSASRIYGDALDRLWGQTRPVPVERLRAVADGESVEVAGLTVIAIDTPGHAGHHHCWRIADLAFTGDVGGVRLPGSNLVALPAPPPEVDLEAWERSIDRLAAAGLRRVYPTHFGESDAVDWHLSALRDALHGAADLVREGLESGLPREAILARYRAWNQARATAAGLGPDAIAAYEAANPLAMSVDGLLRYWRQQGVGAVDGPHASETRLGDPQRRAPG